MEIRIAAAAILREDGATLLVRKRGAQAFMQAGGKIDKGETSAQALCRELSEELDLVIDACDATYLGRFSAPAVNEPDCIVTADLYQIDANVDVSPKAEIEEILWLHRGAEDAVMLAPLTRDFVLPTIWG